MDTGTKGLAQAPLLPAGVSVPSSEGKSESQREACAVLLPSKHCLYNLFLSLLSNLHVFLKFRHSESEIRSLQAAAALPPLSFGATTGYPETRSEPTAWLKVGRGKRLTQGGGSTHQLGSFHIAPSPQLRPQPCELRRGRGEAPGRDVNGSIPPNPCPRLPCPALAALPKRGSMALDPPAGSRKETVAQALAGGSGSPREHWPEGGHLCQ